MLREQLRSGSGNGYWRESWLWPSYVNLCSLLRSENQAMKKLNGIWTLTGRKLYWWWTGPWVSTWMFNCLAASWAMGHAYHVMKAVGLPNAAISEPETLQNPPISLPCLLICASTAFSLCLRLAQLQVWHHASWPNRADESKQWLVSTARPRLLIQIHTPSRRSGNREEHNVKNDVRLTKSVTS